MLSLDHSASKRRHSRPRDRLSAVAMPTVGNMAITRPPSASVAASTKAQALPFALSTKLRRVS
eukprot:8206652-Lingulodinium_polyedra.AAC.1